jgi:hypothetical protein
MSTRTGRLVLLVFLVVGTGFALGALFADGLWQDLWLGLFAETVGAAFIVLFVDRLLERGKQRERDERRRAALQNLRFVLSELQRWLGRLFLQSSSAVADYRKTDYPNGVPAEGFLDGFPRYLGTIDFAAAAPHERDRYLVEWARRSFDETALELARWEQNFAGSAGIFDDDFREGAESLRSFVRQTGSFLEGMERYILRESSGTPVFAYEGVTELTEDGAGRLVSQLRRFLEFYRDQCRSYDVAVPEFDEIFDTAAPSAEEARSPS